MKLFVITHCYGGDGASEMLLSAASHWTQQLGWRVDAVAVPHMPPEASQAVADSGMRLVARAQLQEGYDFALINCLHNIAFVDFIYPHLPIILWAHEAETILHSNVPDEQWKRWFAKVAMLVFQTDWQYQLYKKYLPDHGRVAIIPNGIPPIDVAAKQPGSQGDPFRIVSIGKLTPMKAQADLIGAVCQLAARHRIHCELIGDAGHLPELGKPVQETLHRHPELFTLSGYLPRQRALERAAQADLFCFPSMSESFGLAPLEAAMLGVPVVLADLGPYRSIGWVAGENCLTFPPGDRDRLAVAIETLIGNAALRHSITEKGKKLASRHAMGPCLSKLSEKILELIPDAELKIV